MKKLLTSITIIIFILSFHLANSQSDIYNWSVKFGGGYASTVTFGATNDWWGNSNGPMIFAGLGFKNIHLNASYKYFSEEIKSSLVYNNYILPKDATIRMVHFELTTSYEKEIAYRFFIEPYAGYLQNHITSNIVDNQGNEFDIENIHGATFGVNLIKYIKILEGGFLGFYFNLGYDFINFKKLNPDLNNNSFGYAFGVVLKGVDRKYANRNPN